MFREAPPYGCLTLSRRVLLVTLLAVFVTVTPLTT